MLVTSIKLCPLKISRSHGGDGAQVAQLLKVNFEEGLVAFKSLENYPLRLINVRVMVNLARDTTD